MIGLQPIGLSHSEISGSKVICTYPKLIAAYHVLHRLREPRHPPCALTYFLSYRSRMVDIYFQLLTLLFWSHHVKERCFNYKTIIKTEWRITDSNRWPPACKAGALASWANPPSYKWKTESGKWKIRRVPDFQFSIFSFQLWSSPRQSWTADLYIISVAL